MAKDRIQKLEKRVRELEIELIQIRQLFILLQAIVRKYHPRKEK